MMRHPPSPTLFPYTTLFRSHPSRASARRWALMVPVCTPEPSNTISRLVELTSSISVQVLRQHQWINQTTPYTARANNPNFMTHPMGVNTNVFHRSKVLADSNAFRSSCAFSISVGKCVLLHLSHQWRTSPLIEFVHFITAGRPQRSVEGGFAPNMSQVWPLSVTGVFSHRCSAQQWWRMPCPSAVE